MKKFVFELQKILDLKNLQKSQAEGEFAKALAEENKIQDTLNMVARQRAATVSAADDLTDVGALVNANQYLILLDQRKEKLLNELTKAKLITEEKREIARQFMVEVKGLEKLREKKYAEWQEENQKEEDSEIDNIISAKYNK